MLGQTVAHHKILDKLGEGGMGEVWRAEDTKLGREVVYVRPFPSAVGKWQVSDGGGGWPSWSPDGSEIFYRSNDGLMSATITTEGGSFRAGRPQPLASGVL